MALDCDPRSTTSSTAANLARQGTRPGWGLAAAGTKVLADIRISPSGYGIFFPKLDVDIYLPALMEGIFGTKAWMAERGRKGGQASSKAKKTAARANGKLGGRPRKTEKTYALR